MTLDIQKYLKNLIEKEAKISHFQVKVDSGKAAKIKGQVATTIRNEFGNSYLQDADYVLFFEKAESWTTDDITKLFELVNRALGKDANMLSKSDFNELPNDSAAADTEALDADTPEEAAEVADTTNSEGSNTLFLKITLK